MLLYSFNIVAIACLTVDVSVHQKSCANYCGHVSDASGPTKHRKSRVVRAMGRQIAFFLSKLPASYEEQHPEFRSVISQLQRSLLNGVPRDARRVWEAANEWSNPSYEFPVPNSDLAATIHALKVAKIFRVQNFRGGTQIKYLLTLEGNQNAIFKPKRYEKTHVYRGEAYEGFDRHNSEVLGFVLALLLNMRSVPVAVMRTLHVENELWKYASLDVVKTAVVKDLDTYCLSGNCRHCCRECPVCGDGAGLLEGALVLMIPGVLKKFKSPWQRIYHSSRHSKWETDGTYCKYVKSIKSFQRLLDLVDMSIFDFLLQNGDRNNYEVHMRKKLIILDNGKGLGNPAVDNLEILAPFFQCCVIRYSTWYRLLLLRGHVLMSAIRAIERFLVSKNESITTDDHLKAMDRRIMKIFATMEYCFTVNKSWDVLSS